MKILYTSDLHGNRELYMGLIDLAESTQPDLIILGGDSFPKAHTNENIFSIQTNFAKETLHQYLNFLLEHTSEIFIIFGNDDCRVAVGCANLPEKVYNLTNCKKKLPSGLTIVCFGYVPETPFSLKDWERLDCQKTNIRHPNNNAVISDDGGFAAISAINWFSVNPSIEVELIDLQDESNNIFFCFSCTAI